MYLLNLILGFTTILAVEVVIPILQSRVIKITQGSAVPERQASPWHLVIVQISMACLIFGS